MWQTVWMQSFIAEYSIWLALGNRSFCLFKAVCFKGGVVRRSIPRASLITCSSNYLFNWRIYYNCSIDYLHGGWMWSMQIHYEEVYRKHNNTNNGDKKANTKKYESYHFITRLRQLNSIFHKAKHWLWVLFTESSNAIDITVF